MTGQLRVSDMAATWQRRGSDVSMTCQRRVRDESVAWQLRVSGVSVAWQQRRGTTRLRECAHLFRALPPPPLHLVAPVALEPVHPGQHAPHEVPPPPVHACAPIQNRTPKIDFPDVFGIIGAYIL